MDMHGLEILKVLIVGIVAVCIWLGRKEVRHKGWSYISAGFVLIFSVETMKAVDDFQGLRDFFISEIEHKAIPEKLYILGFFMLAVGVYKWLPSVALRRGQWDELREKHIDTLESLCCLQKAVETANIGVTVTDLEGRILYTNPAEAEMHGYSVEELFGKDARIFAPPEPWVPRKTEEIIKRRRLKRETLNIRRDGTVFPVQLISDVVINPAGSPGGIVTTCEDISERKKLEKITEETCNFLQAVIDGVSEPLMVIGLDHTLLLINKTIRKDLPKHFSGPGDLKCHTVIYNRDTPCERPCPLALVRDSGQPVTFEYNDCHIAGEDHCIEVLASPLFDNKGGLVGIIESARDVTERRKSEETIKYMAYYDTLTKLPNRMLFTERLQQTLSEAHSNNKPVAVMFLDLDRFKIINDTYDHHTGDLLLELVARRLQSLMRDCDTVARLGGDEFILLFPALKSAQDARVLAQKILKIFASAFSTDSYEIYITASIGISIYPADGTDATILIKNADSSMNHAKEQGGNNYQFYSPALDFKCLEQLTLGNNLHKAVEENQLLLHYQPQIDLASGKIFGVETLVRWQHPDWGLMPPKKFIALAEDIGIIIPISEWIMGQAFTQMKKWGENGLAPGKIAVNLSVRQFKEKNLFETILKLLENSGLDPELLELEITESIIMHNPEETIATIRRLRSLGISFSIDDFGTGYSSLNYLKYLPVSRLKIAKCFIDGITTDPNDRNITKTIINLAHNLGMKVIAEGVETLDQLEFLRRYECDEIQGYLFYRPLPEEMVQQLLSEQQEEKTLSENTVCQEDYNILL